MPHKRLSIDLPAKDFKSLQQLAKAMDQSMVGVLMESLNYFKLHNPYDLMSGKRKLNWSTFRSKDPALSEKVDKYLYGA